MLLRITICLMACSPITAFSQSNCVSTGGTYSGSNGNVSYTVGQIDYNAFSGSTGDINLGVQQPYELYKLSLDEISDQIQVSIGPNPTSDLINIKFIDFDAGESYTYSLCDANGKLISSDKITEEETSINLVSFSMGIYFLNITNQNINHSYKIIKHLSK